MDNQNMRKLFIVRRESLGIGGAEKVANRFINSFSEHFDTELIHAGKMINGFSGMTRAQRHFSEPAMGKAPC